MGNIVLSRYVLTFTLSISSEKWKVSFVLLNTSSVLVTFIFSLFRLIAVYCFTISRLGHSRESTTQSMLISPCFACMYVCLNCIKIHLTFLHLLVNRSFRAGVTDKLACSKRGLQNSRQHASHVLSKTELTLLLEKTNNCMASFTQTYQQHCQGGI